MLSKKIGLIVLTFFGLYLITFWAYPQIDWNYYRKLSVLKILFDFVTTLILSTCIVELCFWIDNKMNKSMPWTKQPITRLLLQTMLQIVTVLLLLILFAVITYYLILVLNLQYDTNTENSLGIGYYLASVIFLTLMISAINTVNYLSANWREALVNATEHRIKAAESKQLAAENELQALRLQLDPHFVFNNLSVLSELILQDQQLGFDYTENFAKVYRYLLLNSKKNLISLKEELKFLDSYIFLIRTRLGSGVQFEITVHPSKMELQLPPLTLQLLVENATKHNRIDRETYLVVKIYTAETKVLIVENNLLPLVKKTPSSGLGIENIKSRYAMLSEKNIDIKETENEFSVKLPLL